MNNILILGNGLLGSELHRQSGYDVISKQHNNFDITQINTFNESLLSVEFGAVIYCKYNIIINAIAYTDTYSNDRNAHWNINYKGVADLVDFCNKWKIKLVHIVSDYIYANSVSNASESDVPVHNNTWYAYTKLLSDAHVQLKCNDYLLIRATHKPNPFPYDNAWSNQIGNFDYVNIISKKILSLIHNNATGIYNVGTDIKSMYDLAIQTNKNVNKILIPDNINAPKDVTMNLTKMNNVLQKKLI